MTGDPAGAAGGRRVGEVTAAQTERVTAQCYERHGAPPLGALVRVGAPGVYAVVREVRHEAVDPGRPLAPRGAGLETEDEIYAANPQLATMLTTRFAAVIVGYRGAGGRMMRGLPPLPPPLHAFVFLCDGAETAEFAGELHWLRLLLAERTPGGDAALAGFLRRAAAAVASESSESSKTGTGARAGAGAGAGFLRRAGRILAAELAGEPQRLQAALRELAAQGAAL